MCTLACASFYYAYHIINNAAFFHNSNLVILLYQNDISNLSQTQKRTLSAKKIFNEVYTFEIRLHPFLFFLPGWTKLPFNESLRLSSQQCSYHNHHNHPCLLGCCRFLHNVHTKIQKKSERKTEKKLHKIHKRGIKNEKKTVLNCTK